MLDFVLRGELVMSEEQFEALAAVVDAVREGWEPIVAREDAVTGLLSAYEAGQ